MTPEHDLTDDRNDDHKTDQTGDPQEIERVFLLDAMPDIPESLNSGAVCWKIEQGYLSPSDPVPGQDITEGRLRMVTHADGSATFTHTIKSGLGLVRLERERTLNRAEFEATWPATEGRRILKTRLRIDVEGQIWEIDDFSDRALVLAEAELPTVETALPIPEWLQPRIIREVTEEGAFRNFHLATRKGFHTPDPP